MRESSSCFTAIPAFRGFCGLKRAFVKCEFKCSHEFRTCLRRNGSNEKEKEDVFIPTRLFIAVSQLRTFVQHTIVLQYARFSYELSITAKFEKKLTIITI